MMAASAEMAYDDLLAADVQFSRTLPARSKTGRPSSPPRAQGIRPLDALVALQRADGSWALDAEFAKALSLNLRHLERELRSATGDRESARRALATVIALEWLEKHAGSERGEWEMLAQKATSWLSTLRTEPAAGQGWKAWLDVARRVV